MYYTEKLSISMNRPADDGQVFTHIPQLGGVFLVLLDMYFHLTSPLCVKQCDVGLKELVWEN